MHDYLKTADVTDAIKIMDSYSNEVRLDEEMFDEKSDTEDIIIVDRSR